MKASKFAWRPLLRPQAGPWLLSLILGLLTLVAVAGLLAVSGWFVSTAAVAGMGALYGLYWLSPAGLIRLTALVRTLGRYGERLASHNAVLMLLKNLRLQSFDLLRQRLPLLGSQHGLNSGDLVQRLVGDLDKLDAWPLRVCLPWLWGLGLTSFYALGLYWLSPGLLWAVLPWLLLCLTVVPGLAAWLGTRAASEEAQLAGQRRKLLLENLAGMVSLQAFGRWEHAMQGFYDRDHQLLQRQWRLQKLHILSQTLCLGLLASGLYFLLSQGLILVAADQIGAPWLVAAVLALLALPEALVPIATSFIALGQARGAQQRLRQLEQLPTQAHGQQKAQGPARLQALDLWARMPAAQTGPSGLNFDLHAGQRVWLRGPSGCGKSTLAWICTGLLKPKQGRLLIMGQAPDQYPEAELRTLLALQLQSGHVFNDSLAANLRLAKPKASDEQLWQALAVVELDLWAQSLPQALASPMGELGHPLSGGQSRRLALAQLWLQDSPIKILDEGLEGLDPDMADRILARFCRPRADILLLISHQDLATHHFDWVLTLDEHGHPVTP